MGAAKGLSYMHLMPTPVVHRDVKSGNIMVMEDGETGKIGDCGESRRVVSWYGASSHVRERTQRSVEPDGNTNPTPKGSRRDYDSSWIAVVDYTRGPCRITVQ